MISRNPTMDNVTSPRDNAEKLAKLRIARKPGEIATLPYRANLSLPIRPHRQGITLRVADFPLQIRFR